jgi:hypothetical protein
VKGPNEKCGFGLTCGITRMLLLSVEYAAQLYLMVCTHLSTQFYVRVGPQSLLNCLKVHASPFRRPVTRNFSKELQRSLPSAPSRERPKP